MNDLLDTSAARQAILQRIRRAQQRDATLKEAETQAAQAYLQQPQWGPQPDLGTDLLAVFSLQAEKMADTLALVEQFSEVPTAVHAYLQQHNLPLRACVWPQWASLPWSACGIQIQPAPIQDGELVGVTGVFCALAETGSLLLLSGKDEQIACALLPETHIAIVPQSRIVAGMEQAFALALQERGELPRTSTIISGPSRTGDIEQTIVLGAHGPYRVHVIVVRQA